MKGPKLGKIYIGKERMHNFKILICQNVQDHHSMNKLTLNEPASEWEILGSLGEMFWLFYDK